MKNKTMKKRTLLLLLALLVAFSASGLAARATATPKPTNTPRPTATPKTLDQSMYPLDGATAEADAALRATPYARGRIVDTLRKGLKLTVTGSQYANDGSVWYAVTTKSSKKEGYLPASLVVLDAVPTPTPKPTATPKKTAKPTATPEAAARDNSPIVSRGFIGNTDSKVYHLPTCSYLPNRENQISFSTKAKAESEGYRPCQHCKP